MENSEFKVIRGSGNLGQGELGWDTLIDRSEHADP